MVTRPDVIKQRLPRSDLSDLVAVEEHVIATKAVYETVLSCQLDLCHLAILR